MDKEFVFSFFGTAKTIQTFNVNSTPTLHTFADHFPNVKLVARNHHGSNVLSQGSVLNVAQQLCDVRAAV
jgi:hypothetical protein